MDKNREESMDGGAAGDNERHKDAFDVSVELFLIAFAGVVVSWVVMGLVAGSLDSTGVAWGIFGACVIGLLALMVPKRTRRLATRGAIAFAVGLIAGSGFCASVINSFGG